jgi:hypothetical protein
MFSAIKWDEVVYVARRGKPAVNFLRAIKVLHRGLKLTNRPRRPFTAYKAGLYAKIIAYIFLKAAILWKRG